MDFIIIIVGFYVIFSGFFSALLQKEEKFLNQFVRYLRIIFGIFLVVYSVIWIPIGFLVDIFAMVIIIDGLLSIILQRKDKLYLQAERLIRIIVGAYLLTYSELFIL